MKSTFFIVLIAAFLIGCAGNKSEASANKKQIAIKEIQEAEKDFEKMAADKGILEAFGFYADSNAVIKRQNDSLIYGKEAIRKYYSTPFYNQASVTWSPDFTDASEQGDIGYTYGKYVWRSKDSTRKTTEFRGVFHTVWKRQADGTWRFVWD